MDEGIVSQIADLENGPKERRVVGHLHLRKKTTNANLVNDGLTEITSDHRSSVEAVRSKRSMHTSATVQCTIVGMRTISLLI